MYFLENLDNFCVLTINKIDNYLKYNKEYSDKYYESELLNHQNSDFLFYKNKLYEIIKILNKKVKSKKLILDIGCGTGRYLKIFSKEKIIGIDINSNMLKYAKELSLSQTNISVFNYDLNKFNNIYRGEKFDLIYSIGVFGEHSYLDELSLIKIIKNLKDNGYFFFTFYVSGLRRKNLSKILIILLKTITWLLGLRKTSSYISRENVLNKIIDPISDFVEIEKTEKYTKYKLWQGSHILVTLKKKKNL